MIENLENNSFIYRSNSHSDCNGLFLGCDWPADARQCQKVRICGFAKIITHSFQQKCKKEEKNTVKHETDGSQT